MNTYNNICASQKTISGTTGCAWDVNQINGLSAPLVPESKYTR